MKKLLIAIALLVIIVLGGCNKAKQAETAGDAAMNKITVLAPQTPSALPLYLALKDNPQFSLDFFLNHSQANAKFLRGDAKILLTGISIADSFSKQGVDFQLISAQVDNLSHLVSNKPIASLQDIRDKTIVFPFADSPMEQLFSAIAAKNNLTKDIDYSVTYLPLSTSLQMLQQGSDLLVWQPEPFASIAQNRYNMQVSLSLNDLYAKAFPDSHPAQVILLVRDLDIKNIATINYLTKVYIDSLQTHPELMLKKLGADFPNSQDYTVETLRRTSYYYQDGATLQEAINQLFQITNKENNLADTVLELN